MPVGKVEAKMAGRGTWVLPLSKDLLALPDEKLCATLFASWLGERLQEAGMTPAEWIREPTGPEPSERALALAEDIRRQTLTLDSDDHPVLARILKLIAEDSPGNRPRAARMFRRYMKDGARVIAALDEVRTGRRRQAENARKQRSDFLHFTIIEIVRRKPDISPAELLDELQHLAKPPDGDLETGQPQIERVDREDGVIEWREPGKPAATAPISGLKDRLNRARAALKKVNVALTG